MIILTAIIIVITIIVATLRSFHSLMQRRTVTIHIHITIAFVVISEFDRRKYLLSHW